MSKVDRADNEIKVIEPSALAGQYLRAFSKALGSISDFDAFLETLRILVSEDSFFRGNAELRDPLSTQDAAVPDFDSLDASDVVVAVAGEVGNLGYLKYRGRYDNGAFGAEDMHLLGSIAGFISALMVQADKFRCQSKIEKMLQYLINQLPLGVLCFDGDGELIIQSKSAVRLMGDAGSNRFSEIIVSDKEFVREKVQVHFELEGKLLYSEGRHLKVESGLEVIAFIIYDLSNYREKLLMDLDREAYRSESRGTQLTMALFEREGEAGMIYRQLRGFSESLQIKASCIQPVDAYSCACLFTGKQLRAVRFLLKTIMGKTADSVNVALVQHDQAIEDQAPGESLIEKARAQLTPLEHALLPNLLVLDPYPAIFEALQMMTSEVCRLVSTSDVVLAESQIKSGQYDGLFIDLDSFNREEIARLRDAAKTVGDGFKIYFCSYKQPAMARQFAGLAPSETVLQKPFRVNELTESLTLQFDLA